MSKGYKMKRSFKRMSIRDKNDKLNKRTEKEKRRDN